MDLLMAVNSQWAAMSNNEILAKFNSSCEGILWKYEGQMM